MQIFYENLRNFLVVFFVSIINKSTKKKFKAILWKILIVPFWNKEIFCLATSQTRPAVRWRNFSQKIWYKQMKNCCLMFVASHWRNGFCVQHLLNWERHTGTQTTLPFAIPNYHQPQKKWNSRRWQTDTSWYHIRHVRVVVVGL